MKKVLALVLAVMMMATIAFAADEVQVGSSAVGSSDKEGTWLPGEKIKIDLGSIMKDAPGVYDSGADATDANRIKKVNSSNYSITNVKYDEGKNLVASYSLNDSEDRLEIKLKDDYTNTSAKSLNMTLKLKGKKVGKTKPVDIELRIKGTVGYKLEKPAKFTSNDETVRLDNPEEAVFKFEGDGASYATLELVTDDDEIEVEARVYDGDKLFLYSEIDADDDVLKAYADTDADITFLTFTGTPTLNSTATVRFYKEEGTYFYVNNDGKLVDINGKRASGSALDLTSKVNWDEDEGCYILKTRTLGSYVMSDKKLTVSAANTADNIGATQNPDTGANDVVGIATALAAVALVSAAAVSLKK